MSLEIGKTVVEVRKYGGSLLGPESPSLSHGFSKDTSQVRSDGLTLAGVFPTGWSGEMYLRFASIEKLNFYMDNFRVLKNENDMKQNFPFSLCSFSFNVRYACGRPTDFQLFTSRPEVICAHFSLFCIDVRLRTYD